MNWFKSRYAASLEQQIQELKADKKRLQDQIDTMLRERTEAHARTGTPEKAKAKTDEKETPLPKVGNWLRTRAALESNNFVSEVEPDKEKSANGSR